MPRAVLSPADKMCRSSATSTLCTDCAGTSPMYHRTSVLPWGWATNPRTGGGGAWGSGWGTDPRPTGGGTSGGGWATHSDCGDQLCCVPGAGAQFSHGFACAPRTMNCDSTRHIQKSSPTPDHARIGTALSSTSTLNGDVPIGTPRGLHASVYVISLKVDHGES